MNLNGRKSIRSCEVNKETLAEFIIHQRVIRMDVLVRYIQRLRGEESFSKAKIDRYLKNPNPKGYEVVHIVTEEGQQRSAHSTQLSSLYLVHDFDIKSSLDALRTEKVNRLLVQEIIDCGNYTPVEIEYINNHFLLGALHFFEDPEDVIEIANKTEVNKEYTKNNLKKESIFISTLNLPAESIKNLMEEYGIENLMIPIDAEKNGKSYIKKSLEGLNLSFYDVNYKETLNNLHELHYYIT